MASGNADNTADARLTARQCHTVRLWPWLSIIGGATLCFPFFLPAYTTFLSGISPAARCAAALRGIRFTDSTPGLFTSGRMGDFDAAVMYYGGTIAACLCPYLAGFITALAARTRLRESRGACWWNRLFMAVIIMATCATLVIWSVHSVCVCLFMSGPLWTRLRPLSWWFWPLAASALIIYLSRAGRHRKYAHFHAVFAFAVVLAIWFEANFQTALYGGFPNSTVGTPVAMIGTTLLAVGAFGEFHSIADIGWLQTLRYLLTAAAPLEGACCRRCGYDLRGLREMRCPECGRPFTLEEITPRSDSPEHDTTI